MPQDSWRHTLWGFTGDYNLQYFTSTQETSGFYDFGTEATIVSAGFQHKLFTHAYIGLNYTYSHYYAEYEDGITPPSTTETNGLEIMS